MPCPAEGAKEVPSRSRSRSRERLRRAKRSHGRTLVLFDVDGTLAVPAQPASAEMLALLSRLSDHYAVGIVGAGDFQKQQGQLGGEGLRSRLDFVFSENGVHSFRGSQLLHCKSLAEHLGEKLWSSFRSELDAMLSSCSEEAEALLRKAVEDPAATLSARQTFLEIRQCTVNICIIGRTPAMNKLERAAFERVDAAAGLRRRFLSELVAKFGPGTEYNLSFSIGGQIGIDCAPVGWDKTFCLQFVDPAEFDVVHFFGDKTEEGGGDHELFVHPRTVGHTVRDAADTMAQIEAKLLSPEVLASQGK
eukprot:TRINITY_DN73007_c0_g1_i1.p1 TRINITY_DN73007_c0_g1~~TRINITY_DN73007_c0_g1_i1.p1  ORF type:complete len:316 (-),score=71.69 TRINITY_DN73007_c0_g1_i1:194-1108(-)